MAPKTAANYVTFLAQVLARPPVYLPLPAGCRFTLPGYPLPSPGEFPLVDDLGKKFQIAGFCGSTRPHFSVFLFQSLELLCDMRPLRADVERQLASGRKPRLVLGMVRDVLDGIAGFGGGLTVQNAEQLRSELLAYDFFELLVRHWGISAERARRHWQRTRDPSLTTDAELQEEDAALAKVAARSRKKPRVDSQAEAHARAASLASGAGVGGVAEAVEGASGRNEIGASVAKEKTGDGAEGAAANESDPIIIACVDSQDEDIHSPDDEAHTPSSTGTAPADRSSSGSAPLRWSSSSGEEQRSPGSPARLPEAVVITEIARAETVLNISASTSWADDKSEYLIDFSRLVPQERFPGVFVTRKRRGKVGIAPCCY